MFVSLCQAVRFSTTERKKMENVIVIIIIFKIIMKDVIFFDPWLFLIISGLRPLLARQGYDLTSSMIISNKLYENPIAAEKYTRDELWSIRATCIPGTTRHVGRTPVNTVP